jgi:hypothetical protein
MIYQERLLLYCDILGWSAEIKAGESSKLLAAVEKIHQRAEAHNERERETLLAQDGKTIQTELGPRRAIVNHSALEVQYGAFSDHFVFSLPASFGSRILNIASQLIIELLRTGFLVRGAVAVGSLYHKDNITFGPALLEAVKIEEVEAFYPRILVSDTVIDHCSKLPNDPRHKAMITDQTGRLVINPFAMPFDGPDDMIKSFVELNFFLPEIKTMLEQQIARLETEHRYQHAEKWRYFTQFIEGPVLQAAPKLRPYW